MNCPKCGKEATYTGTNRDTTDHTALIVNREVWPSKLFLKQEITYKCEDCNISITKTETHTYIPS